MLSESEYRPIPVSMDQDPLQIYKARVELRPADLRALSGATKVIVPGVPGYVISPNISQWDRLAGDAYTVNGLANLALLWQGTVTPVLSSVNPVGLVNGTTAKTAVMASNLFSATGAAIGTGEGVPLVVGRISGTDLSGGTGSVIVTVWYRLFRVPQEGRRA